MRPDLFVLDRHRRNHAQQCAIIERGCDTAGGTLRPQFLPRQPRRGAPSGHPRFIGVLAGGVHIDPGHFEIAGGGDRRDAAIALDLGPHNRPADACQQQARAHDSQPGIA